MSTRKSLGERLALLAKSQGKSQAEIADQINMAPSQLNRFFKGHCDIYANNAFDILKELGLDIEDIVLKRLKDVAELEQSDPKSKNETILFLYNRLDELGKQTVLAQLLWAVKLGNKDAIPKKLENEIRKDITLI